MEESWTAQECLESTEDAIIVCDIAIALTRSLGPVRLDPPSARCTFRCEDPRYVRRLQSNQLDLHPAGSRGLVACVGCAGWLDEKNRRLVFGEGLMFDPDRNHE